MGAIQVPKSFADDFEAACRWWERIGQGEDIPEIREAARQAFAADQFIAEWTAWIKSLADFQRELDGASPRPTSCRVAELRQAASDKAVVSEARVIEELARIGLFDPGHLFADDGSLLPVKKMPPAVRAAIASVEVDEIFDGAGKDRKFIGYTKKIKLWDKNSALEKIMRHLGSFLLDNKQRTPFAGVSRETVKGIVERLEALRGGA